MIFILNQYRLWALHSIIVDTVSEIRTICERCHLHSLILSGIKEISEHSQLSLHCSFIRYSENRKSKKSSALICDVPRNIFYSAAIPLPQSPSCILHEHLGISLGYSPPLSQYIYQYNTYFSNRAQIGTTSSLALFFLKVCIYFSFIQCIHIWYIIHSETFLHSCRLVGRNLHGVPRRDSNSDLPYSKPTHYWLSHAAT